MSEVVTIHAHRGGRYATGYPIPPPGPHTPIRRQSRSSGGGRLFSLCLRAGRGAGPGEWRLKTCCRKWRYFRAFFPAGNPLWLQSASMMRMLALWGTNQSISCNFIQAAFGQHRHLLGHGIDGPFEHRAAVLVDLVVGDDVLAVDLFAHIGQVKVFAAVAAAARDGSPGYCLWARLPGAQRRRRRRKGCRSCGLRNW
jgi:hypothetical protein